MSTFRVAMAQLDLLVGDVAGNVDQMLDAVARARDEWGADVIVFPELALTGYPPEDLLNHAGLRAQVATALVRLCDAVRGIHAIIGFPDYSADGVYNAAAVLGDGQLRAVARKQVIPTYSVFDEQRYFRAGDEVTVVDIGGVAVGVCICEDLWQAEPVTALARQGAAAVVALNASPFERDKQAMREATVSERARTAGVPVAYVNLVSGQDELVFDGGSFAMTANGEVAVRAPACESAIVCADFVRPDAPAALTLQTGDITPIAPTEQAVYDAIVYGVRDYVRKTRFPGAVIGLSGGIDSALTLAVAVDALGADNVMAVMMPSRYTVDLSLSEAERQAKMLGVDYRVIPVEEVVTALNTALADVFAGREPDTTEENIQARCRGVILMAISNKTGKLLLSTGNKSELAVGYATLYGDMAGGFAPLRDLTKTMVYRLSRYRNGISPAIPEKVITREPSAELAADQKDSDSLPPYDVLDPILEAYVEEDLSVAEIVARGFDHAVVSRIVAMVQRNEYKRRQGAPGVRISHRAFGRDRRYPITSGYNPLADES